MNAEASLVVRNTIHPDVSVGNWNPPSIDDPNIGKKNDATSETTPTIM